jgi:hypothetical protein
MTQYGTQGEEFLGALVTSGLTLGVGATQVTKLQWYSAVLAHSTVMNTGRTEERIYAVTGVVTGEVIIAFEFQTTPTLSGVFVGGYRISSSDNIAILWGATSAAVSTNSAFFSTDVHIVTLKVG